MNSDIKNSLQHLYNDTMHEYKMSGDGFERALFEWNIENNLKKTAIEVSTGGTALFSM